MMTTKYSVGIPVRNEEKTIRDTINSILKQSVQANEIHVCVNGSNDNTYKIVSDIASTEKQINLLRSSPGKANAWNKITSNSIDNKILFCDGDVTLNPAAAENMLNTFQRDKNLIIVGGSNAFISSQRTTLFSKFFTENLNGKPIKQGWLCGRLYMTKLRELSYLANKLELELMPTDIINEDGFLEMLTKNHKKIIDSAYNLSFQISTFHDWYIGVKRILTGQKQLKEKFPQYFGDSELSIKRLKNYFTRFKEIKSLRKKVGVTTLFLLRIGLNVSYKFSNNLNYSPLWPETKSTKNNNLSQNTYAH